MIGRKKKIIEYAAKISFVITAVTFLLSAVFLTISQNYYLMLWVCPVAISLIFLGMIKKNPNLILSQVIIILVPNLIYFISAIIELITGTQILNTENFGARNFLEKIIYLQHIYILFAGLIFLAYIGAKNKSHKIIVAIITIQLSTLYILTKFLVPTTMNVNCVHQGCLKFSANISPVPYDLALQLFVILMIVFSYFFIMLLPFIRKK